MTLTRTILVLSGLTAVSLGIFGLYEGFVVKSKESSSSGTPPKDKSGKQGQIIPLSPN